MLDLEPPGPAGAPVAPHVLEARLALFMDLLLSWNGRINLVAEQDVRAIRHRHIDDSLQLLPLLPQGDEPIADLGSGGGFPGLILASASSRMVHLVEADRRKSAFLINAAGRLGLANVRIHPLRVESALLPPLAAVTSRALAPLAELLPLAARLLAPGGIALFPKGRGARSEVAAARADWTFDLAQYPSRTADDATILRLSNIMHAGRDG